MPQNIRLWGPVRSLDIGAEASACHSDVACSNSIDLPQLLPSCIWIWRCWAHMYLARLSTMNALQAKGCHMVLTGMHKHV